MNSKRVIRIIAIILAFLMLFSIVMIAIEALASSGPVASARVTQDQINKLREEKAEYERQKREINSRINTIEFERMAEIERKEILDERITLTGLEIDNINETIEQYNLLITEKEYEIVISQNREEEQLRRYKARVRDMEENGEITYLEIIFDSTSFSDLLARIDFVRDIMQADETSYRALQLSRALTLAAKDDLEATKEEIEDEVLKLEELRAELEIQLEEAHALIVIMENNLETAFQLRDKVIEDQERIQKEINAAEEELRRERERARLAAQRANQTNTGTTYTTGSGELMWPVSGTITSYYGRRPHPVYGDNRMHTGIDIGAPHGTSVVAADGGTVLTSSYDSSYGNYIVISHGNQVTTLYAHLSSRRVSAGNSVSKGQLIGLVGSTGVSTGPHLHFEVSVNGSRVNPLTKLS